MNNQVAPIAEDLNPLYETVCCSENPDAQTLVMLIERLSRAESALAEALRERDEAREKCRIYSDQQTEDRDLIESLKRKCEAMARPVSEEEASCSFGIWNGVCINSTQWDELDESDRERWRKAVESVRPIAPPAPEGNKDAL